jgi:hypothetical protein
MSQPRSSSENNVQYICEREIRAHLDRYLGQITRPGFFGRLALRLQDPFTDKNSFRLNPFWASLGVLFALAVSVFFYFNVMRP